MDYTGEIYQDNTENKGRGGDLLNDTLGAGFVFGWFHTYSRTRDFAATHSGPWSYIIITLLFLSKKTKQISK